MSRDSVNDIYDPDLYAREGDPDDIYLESDVSRDSFDPELSGSSEFVKQLDKIDELHEEIAGLRQEIGYKDEMIDLLKIHNESCKKEKDTLTQENKKYILLLEELSSSQRKLKGGNNKHIKNVSKRSTASYHHATRRHSSQRKKSGTLRRVRR